MTAQPEPAQDERGTGRLLAVTIAMAAAATAGVWLLHSQSSAPLTGHLHPALLAGLVVLTELCGVHVYLRRETHTVSLREIPLVIGFFVVSPLQLALTYAFSAAAVLLIRAHVRGIKLFFNISMLLLEAAVGIAVFRATVGDAGALAPRAWAAALLAAVVVDMLGGMLVSIAIWLHQGTFELASVKWMALTGALASAANASFGLVAVILVSTVPAGAVLLGGIGATMFVAYRSYAALRRRHSDLELLQEFTRLISQALSFEEAATLALRKARTLLDADRAELRFFLPGSDELGIRICVTGDDDPVIEREYRLLLIDRLWTRVAQANGAVVLARKIREGEDRVVLEEQNSKDLVAAPLHTDGGLVGLIVLSDRLGDVATFDANDGRLLAALCGYTSVALENGRLVDELQREATRREHEALHDPLTDMPNRRCFVEHAEAEIRGQTRKERVAAVFLLDLDRFKDVNDTFGHPSGDALLIEVAARLREVVRRPDIIARLGGDEFAIMISGLPSGAAAEGAAQRIYDAVAQPYTVSGVSVQVDASIGIANFPDHGTDVATLLRCADIAMYAAKEQRAGFVTYSSKVDHHTPERLALAADLRVALDNGAFSLGYQPTLDLASGRITGVEALARWEHPTRGMLPPPEYIAVAERTGLIRQLTRYVLREALQQRQAWTREGVDLRVSVNVSVHDLHVSDFASEVKRLLRATGTPHGRLVLEITETQALDRPERIAPVLAELRAAGVVISIDDFGTGYSSLTALRALPVDEVKIDKSFVRDMLVNDHDDAIVRSIIELARRMQLRIVAEGVEDGATLHQLELLGCHAVQGYFLSKALPAAELAEWFREQEHARALVGRH